MKTFSSLSFMLYPLFHGVAKYTVYCNTFSSFGDGAQSYAATHGCRHTCEYQLSEYR